MGMGATPSFNTAAIQTPLPSGPTGLSAASNQSASGAPDLSAIPTAAQTAMATPIAAVAPVASQTTPVTNTTPIETIVTPMASTTSVSDPNTSTLGTGQTSNPYFNSANPYIQAAQATTMGNLYGARAATQANRINQNTPYGSLNYVQGVDANGNPTWTANQQLSPELQALTQSSLAGLQASQANPMYGINPGQTYSEAIMQRLQPQMQQQQKAQAAALANQGIVPGTVAYDNAMRTFNQQQNDLLTSAQIQGMNTGLQAQNLQNQTASNIKALANPNYINPYTQAAVSGPDYLGAYTTSNAANIAAQNAQAAKTANLQNGLFGLGSSAILGAGGLGNLGSSILGGATTLGGLLGLGATPGLGQTTNWLGQVVTDPTYGAGDAYSNMTASEISNMMDWGI